MTLLDAITAATAKGFKVEHRDDFGGWVVISPARPRHPSEVHASFQNETRAWFAAAALASEH